MTDNSTDQPTEVVPDPTATPDQKALPVKGAGLRPVAEQLAKVLDSIGSIDPIQQPLLDAQGLLLAEEIIRLLRAVPRALRTRYAREVGSRELGDCQEPVEVELLCHRAGEGNENFPFDKRADPLRQQWKDADRTFNVALR